MREQERRLLRLAVEGVIRDGTVVDRTWRYVNKNGGPDRRFNNNAQLPVMQYGVLVLTSSRGLNIHLNTSNPQLANVFANSWRRTRSFGKSWKAWNKSLQNTMSVLRSFLTRSANSRVFSPCTA